MALSRALVFALVNWVTFTCLEAQKTTTINCDVPPATLELTGFVDGYTGDIEWITDIPADVNLALTSPIFPEHLNYVQLEYNSALRNATVRTSKALDVETLKSEFVWYTIVCQRIGTSTPIENPRNVEVKDLNDNAPKFQQTSYSASVSEVAEISFTVIKVEAKDDDFSPQFNILTYSLSGPDSDYFYIRQGDGSVIVNKTLDYNKVHLFNLTVQAKEQFGDQSDTASLIINVEDYDTLNPCFSQSVYNGNISEIQEGALTILPEAILAQDGDRGINEPVVYSIKLVNPPAYNNNFSINASTGVLKVEAPIDREICPSLVVAIQAAQQDKSFKTADAVVLVTIEDVNDNAPVLSQSSYNVSILENFPNGMEVLQVTATDQDEGGFQGTFALTPDDSPFQLSQAGILTVRNSTLLDRERIPSIQLQVTARDHLPPHSEAHSPINILLLDENDNSPTFRGTPYEQDLFLNMTAGMAILQVAADDPDDGINGEISFILAGGNEDGYFELDTSTGQISLKTEIPLGINQLKKFVLWITATDGGAVPRSSSVPVQITAVGDSRPQFTQKTYNVSVEEELVSPVVVAQVEYESLNPHIQVEFQMLTESATFAINGTGVISTNTKLDYESQKNYTLTISLSDGNTTDYATVFVTVLDVNDNSPVFGATNTTVNVPENVPPGTSVTRVSATDVDEGFNGLVVYTLKGGEGKMDIDTSGLILLEKELDRETQDLYNLTVIASDQGQPARSTALNVTVIVGDVNDNPPVFSSSVYTVDVPEDEVVGRALLTVSATDLDAGDNALVKYQIVSQEPPTPSPMFLVNATTGQLSLSQQLDYETIKRFLVEVEASDGGQPSLSNKTLVVVNVVDVNDNPPEFSQAAYQISVFENLQKGSPVYTFSVADKDEAGFSQGHFIHNSTSFTVDMPGTLSLRNDTELDRETTSAFTLQVWAVDADTNGLNSSALFHVTVLDVNDNNPEFQMQPYNFEIPEGEYMSSAPTKVGNVTATDLDEGENARITYYLSAEDGDNPYSIQQDGTILVTGSVDREAKEKYELLLVASDNGAPRRQNFTRVSIQVLDVNDNPPQFTKAQYSASVRVATAKEGEFVLAVSATDPDAGNNSVISYSFMDPSDDFHINTLTGEITLSRSLDHITADTVVTLTVVAADHGVPQLTSQVSVTLYLLVNDTSFGLTFESSSYEFSIDENEPSGTAVGSVKALTGSIAVQVVYSLKSHRDKFSVGDQGDIVALVGLDREEVDLYSIIVEAVDSVLPPSTAVALVTVRVNDVNDNSPVFPVWIQTKLSAPENAAGLDLGTYSATDLDIGVNALITYSLEDDFAGTFHIDSSTGKLMTNTSLDRETVDSYELKIIATDSGNPPQSASLVLSLTVEDVNDNPPVFPQKSYSVTVRENEPPHVILNAAATDADIGYNAIIYYTITGETTSFHVGELSGDIATLEPLDYESRSQYTFTLKASNPGEPNLQDTANITVTVEDVNEEGPVFDKPSYHQILLDNSTAGTLVVDINARDEGKDYDEGIIYNITGGNSEGLFNLSSTTGELKLTRDLSKQTEPQYYSLNVTATDSGLPPLSTSVKVSVTVVPVGVSFPVFSEAAYHPAPLSEKALPDTFVVQTSVLYSAPVSYTIVSGDDKGYFMIDSSSGIIRTTKNLKLEDFPVTFNVRATDSTDAAIFTEVPVEVEVIDENDFPPVFPSSLLEATLAENLTATEIVQLKAQDNDTGRNGLLTYGILNGHGLKFRINETTGVLYSNTTFDYEEEPTEYQVVVYAEDDGIPEKKRGYCTVVIKITDVNDWPPVFEPVAEFSVNENVPVGFIVGKVTATDRDTGDNAFVLYNLTDGGENIFEIDEIQGIIKIKNSPDYETMDKYNLTVTAVNNKSAPFYQATTSVAVLVMDVNDNAPVFAQDSYSASINMINPVGAHVITVSATDKDQGQNGLVEYYILPDLKVSPFFLVENPSEGKIITTGNLSRSGEIHLTVMAKDKGSPPLNGTALITLNVSDNRPFLPRFNGSEISISVLENTGVDYLIYALTLVGDSGALIDFSVVSGNEKGHFRLDPTSGELRTAVNLNYEEVPQYVLLIQATPLLGKISPAAEVQHSDLFAENVAMLTISVQDVNEEPVFVSDSYSARIPNSVPYKHPVITVQATDPDSGDNGLVLYSLVNHQTNEFDINENTGEIFTVSVAGKAGTFYLEVQAADQGTRSLTARTTVNVTVDSSSSSNIVMVVLNQQTNVVERNIAEVKRVLDDKLAWNVYIVDVYSNEFERKARSSTDETQIEIIAFDEAHQEVPAQDVKRKLKEQSGNIEAELEKVFSTSVTAAIGESPAASTSPELIAAIVLSVVLACTFIAFLVYVVLDVKRKRRRGQQHLVKKQAESMEGIDNPWAMDKNGSLKSLEKLEHMNNGRSEVLSFDNIYSTRGGEADRDEIQAPEKGNYLETIPPDYNSEHEDEKAAELGNTEAQPAVAFVTKQDSFLTDTAQKSAPPITPQPPSAAPGKELKGVKFSEVAVILDADDEPEDYELEDDEPEGDEAGYDISL
ncbi:PREDICTED: protocadherin Fat 4-like [Lepidothrix coronata]|uniref:Protocadherin Fat 4-like n=1 Tax=Lepidothrix coronata TaxID=321398 RepID=A0A6J0HSV1_9PASS|nr:PREDICTED: protocadherin Fat 4-like [Lepidothrix coronata]